MVTQAFELECKSYDRKEDGGEKKYTEKMNNCYGHTTDNEINTDDGDEMNQSGFTVWTYSPRDVVEEALKADGIDLED